MKVCPPGLGWADAQVGFLPCRGSSCAHKPRPHLYRQAPLQKPVLHHLAYQAPHLDAAPAAGERMPWGAADGCASMGSPCDSTSISILCGTANFVGLPEQGIHFFHMSLKSSGSQHLGRRGFGVTNLPMSPSAQ